MITIEGVFDTTDQNAVLTVTLGKHTSKNLFVPLRAQKTIPCTPSPCPTKTETGTKIHSHLNFESQKRQQERRMFPSGVVKSCKTVNLIPPTLALYANQCKAALALGQTDGDKAIYTLYIDNVAQKEIYFDSDRKFYENLTSGAHMYRFHVEDLAGNKVELTQKLDCYPPIRKAKICH